MRENELGKAMQHRESLLGRGGRCRAFGGYPWEPGISSRERRRDLGCRKENAEQQLGSSGFVYTAEICVWDDDFTVDSRLIFSQMCFQPV